jgi:hypothetical protein
MKRRRHFGCAEHVGDALEVVSHCGDADFGSRTGQTTHQQTRMSENAVFDRREGVFVGPREISTNVSATKSFPIYESFNVQLRVEAFNVFNHPNITAISTAAGAGNFGQALSAGDPRIMEGALRINF